MMLTVPVASSAYWVPFLTRAIRALLSSTPTASGLTSPSSVVAGPWPRKTIRPVPTTTSRLGTRTPPMVTSCGPKVRLPSMVTKSPIFSEAPEMLISSTWLAVGANFTLSVLPPRTTEVSISVLRMVLNLTSAVAPAVIGAKSASRVPET